jgi:lysophospholipase L1-like esterase
MRVRIPAILSGSGNSVFDTRFNDKATMFITASVSLTIGGIDNGQTVMIAVTQDSVGGHMLSILPYPDTENVTSSSAGIDTAPFATTNVIITRINGMLNLMYVSLNGNGGFSGSQIAGKTYDQSNWASLSDFSVNTVGATVGAGKILIPDAGVTNFTKSLQLAAYSCVNHWKVEIEFQLTTAISGSTTGISIGTQSTNVDSLNSWAVYFSSATTNTGRMEFFGQSNNGDWTTISAAGSNLTFVANDMVRLSMQRVNQLIIMRAENLTNPVAPVYFTATAPFNSNPIPPNTGHFTIWGQGGTFRINKFSVSNNELKNPNILLLGDSKTMGYGATDFYNTYPGILGRYYSNLAISAGFGDKTSDLLSHLDEIIKIAPRQVVLMIGSNDLRFGISDGTFQANYSVITSRLEQAGIQVIHLSPSFEVDLDLTGQYTYITSNYSTVIDIFYKSREAGMLYSDNIHWSNIMNRDVVQALRDSNLLIGAKTDQEYYQ